MEAMVPEETQEEGKEMNDDNTVSREMPRYQCHKIVWALKIKNISVPEGVAYSETCPPPRLVITPDDDGYDPFIVGLEYVQKHNPQVGGYFVVYKGGYKSYSPCDVFEDGYTKIG